MRKLEESVSVCTYAAGGMCWQGSQGNPVDFPTEIVV